MASIQICEARITFPAGGVSAEAEDLVRGCLCLSPGARIRLEDVLSHPWLTRLVTDKTFFKDLIFGKGVTKSYLVLLLER